MSLQTDLITVLNRKGANLADDASDAEIFSAVLRFGPQQRTANSIAESAALPNTGNQPTLDASAGNTPYSRLLGCSPSMVTPAKAAAAFQQEIGRMVREDGLSLNDAWAQLRQLEPDVFDRFNQAPLPPSGSAPLDNGTGAPQPMALQKIIAQKPAITAALHLPPNVDNDVLAAALKANGNQFAKVDAKKVFTAVHISVMKQTGLTASDAMSPMIDDYPALCQAAGQMPSQARTPGGKSGSKS